MTDPDLSGVLRDVLAGPDTASMGQPSRLRVAMQRQLGPDAAANRGRIHQLVVAAEERVPLRLRRDGSSAQVQQELVDMLAIARGWTPEAAGWAVATWAEALGPDGAVVDRPAAGAGAVPGNVGLRPGTGIAGAEQDLEPPTDPPVATGLPSMTDSSETTDLPQVTDLPETTDLPSVTGLLGVTDLPHVSGNPAEAPGFGIGTGFRGRAESVEVGGSLGPTPSEGEAPMPMGGHPLGEPVGIDLDRLPTRQTKAVRTRAEGQLGHPVHVAYQVKGSNPANVAVAALLLIGALVTGGLVGSLLLVLFPLTVAAIQLATPTFVLAVTDSRVKVLAASRLGRPKKLIHDVTTADITLAGGGPFTSIRIRDLRLWFLVPHRGAAAVLAGVGGEAG